MADATAAVWELELASGLVAHSGRRSAATMETTMGVRWDSYLDGAREMTMAKRLAALTVDHSVDKLVLQLVAVRGDSKVAYLVLKLVSETAKTQDNE
jgi:hypothetical protein